MLMSCTVSFEAWNSCHRHRARSVSPEIGPPWTPGLPQFTGLDVPFESQTSLSLSPSRARQHHQHDDATVQHLLHDSAPS